MSNIDAVRRYREKNKEKVKASGRETKRKFRARDRKYYNNLCQNWRLDNPENVLLYGARERAKRRQIECTITVDDIVIPELCPVFGSPLIKNAGRGPGDNSPTLDRRDPRKGYTPDNIWVISAKANRIKNDATIEELKLVLEALQKVPQ